MKNNSFLILTICVTLFAEVRTVGAEAEGPDAPLQLVVMDPLAAPLSCPCVEGYAQRDYHVLSEQLSSLLRRSIRVTFGESYAAAVKKAGGVADIVIGKNSVVRADTAAMKQKMLAVAHLTDMQGSTEQHGLIVVNREDPARTVKDLKGYTIIFGPAESDEKHAAALSLLKTAGVSVPTKLTIDAACSEGACTVIELGPKSRTAAVISSYAQPLLEGCGTIRKGDLRVVAKTSPVPFVTAFVSARLSMQERTEIVKSLRDVSTQPSVLEAMESLVGFLPISDAKVAENTAKKK